MAKRKLIRFEEALIDAKCGQRIARAGWNGNGMYITLLPGRSVKGQQHREYFALMTTDGDLVPWCVDASDLLMDDWYLV